jgi:hypothetical protein
VAAKGTSDPAGFIGQLKDMRINILGLAYESRPTGYEWLGNVRKPVYP